MKTHHSPAFILLDNAYWSLSADSIRPLPVSELRLIDAVFMGMVGVLDNLIL